MNPREMTTGEAEAWRQGWLAAQKAAAAAVKREGERWAWSAAEYAEAAAAVIDAMQPPERPK
jgi:hypothetical protein